MRVTRSKEKRRKKSGQEDSSINEDTGDVKREERRSRHLLSGIGHFLAHADGLASRSMSRSLFFRRATTSRSRSYTNTSISERGLEIKETSMKKFYDFKISKSTLDTVTVEHR